MFHLLVVLMFSAFALSLGLALDLFHGNSPSRGMQNHSGGAYDQSAMQDLMDGDSFQGGLTSLTGTTAGGNPDAINPHVSGNYIIDSGNVDGITLGAPTSDVDDGLSINIWSDSAFAHTITCPAAIIAAGVALKTVITLPAFPGAGVSLRAIDGHWHIVGQSFTAVGLA